MRLRFLIIFSILEGNDGLSAEQVHQINMLGGKEVGLLTFDIQNAVELTLIRFVLIVWLVIHDKRDGYFTLCFWLAFEVVWVGLCITRDIGFTIPGDLQLTGGQFDVEDPVLANDRDQDGDSLTVVGVNGTTSLSGTSDQARLSTISTTRTIDTVEWKKMP